MDSFVRMGMLTTNGSLSSEELDNYIKDFELAFGEFPKVSIKVNATPLDSLNPDYHPKIYLKDGESKLDFRADIHIMNPIDPTIDAALISCQFIVDLSFHVD